VPVQVHQPSAHLPAHPPDLLLRDEPVFFKLPRTQNHPVQKVTLLRILHQNDKVPVAATILLEKREVVFDQVGILQLEEFCFFYDILAHLGSDAVAYVDLFHGYELR
jgi:hypothetical protein